MLIARLIAGSTISETSLDGLRPLMKAAGLELTSSRALENSADVLELSIDGDDIAALAKVLQGHFGPCDALIARDEVRVPQLFVSDMDSTMIGQECIDELGDFAGLKEKISDITERAMQGELDFETALLERVGLLADLDESAITRCLDERITPNEGARVLVETLKSRGARTVLVTGGFHHFADDVAQQIGFERVVGNILEVADGKLTGKLGGPITDSATKLSVLNEELAKLGEGACSMAAGDGANDIPMLEGADYGIAYYAKPKARDAANGWVEQGDLTNLLKLLDIAQSDWVAG